MPKNVTKQVASEKLTFKTLGLDLHLDSKDRQSDVQEFTSSSRHVANDIIIYINSYLNDQDIQLRIRDLEIFDIAVMEVLDNVFQAQDKSKVAPYHLQLSCGFDKDKFVLPVGANTGNVNKIAVLSSIQRKMQFSPGNDNALNSEDEYIDGKYFGSQGRGFYIIQKGVHRLSVVILDKAAAKKFSLSEPWFETSIVLYF